MNKINVYLETGKKKTFAGGIDWPGWSRSAKDEDAALQFLIEYGPRYAQAMDMGDIEFHAPSDVSELLVAERHEGNATTDFGAPVVTLNADTEPIDRVDLTRFQGILQACWRAFDGAVERAAGKELRRGPRGGGRDLEQILDHVLEADRGYLSRLAWKHNRDDGVESLEELTRTRQAILDALDVAVRGELPEKGPRGGIIWSPRYFVRRVAWHILDHAWEIEDRIL